MTERIHDEELDTSEETVRSLLSEQWPELATLPMSYLRTSGTSNALWRVHRTDGGDHVVRLPRTPGAERGILTERKLLPALRSTLLGQVVKLPELLLHGEPGESFPRRWAVLNWIGGGDVWSAGIEAEAQSMQLAADLADAVKIIGSLEDLPAPKRSSGDRGGPLLPLLDRLDRWLDDPRWSASELVDTAAVRRCATQSAEISDQPPTIGFVHGDLIPGNLLIADRQLSAIIDWGGAGYGDTAQDLSPAWSIFDPDARQVFRNALEADDATWLRARAFDLEQAVGGVLYYKPRRHPLGDVMAATLARILADSGSG